MSTTDLNTIIRAITRNMILILAPFIISGVGIEIRDHFLLKNKVDRIELEAHFSELYLLNTEITTLMKEYIRADEREKDQIWQRIEEIYNRFDSFVPPPDVRRGGYGKDMSSLGGGG